MAKFVYVGSGNQAPLATRAYGVFFERGGEPKEISSKAYAAKLRGNPSFIEVDDAKPVAEPKSEPIKVTLKAPAKESK